MEADMNNESTLSARLREVLKEHQRDGLNMIGNVDKLVASLVQAVQDWENDHEKTQRRSA
jgi:hypothetical protein